jgi:hypothetical protein
MSLNLFLRRVAPAKLDHLMKHPEEACEFLHGDNALPISGALTFTTPQEFVDWVVRNKPMPKAPQASADIRKILASVPPRRPAAECDEIDIGKAWDDIHYLLKGSDDLARTLLLSRHRQIPIKGWTDCPWALSSEEVARFAEAIEPITRAQLRARFDAKAMEAERLYPAGLERDDTWFESLWRYFESLREFMMAAHAKGEAVILRIA